MASTSGPRGTGSRRTSATAPRIALLTRSRPRPSAPGDKASPAARTPTNAEPQSVTVTSPAITATTSVRLAAVTAAAFPVIFKLLRNAHLALPNAAQRQRCSGVNGTVFISSEATARRGHQIAAVPGRHAPSRTPREPGDLDRRMPPPSSSRPGGDRAGQGGPPRHGLVEGPPRAVPAYGADLPHTAPAHAPVPVWRGERLPELGGPTSWRCARTARPRRQSSPAPAAGFP